MSKLFTVADLRLVIQFLYPDDDNMDELLLRLWVNGEVCEPLMERLS